MKKILIMLMLSASMLAQVWTTETLGSDVNFEEVPVTVQIGDDRLYISLEIAGSYSEYETFEDWADGSYVDVKFTTPSGKCFVKKSMVVHYKNKLIVCVPISESQVPNLMTKCYTISIGKLEVYMGEDYEDEIN